MTGRSDYVGRLESETFSGDPRAQRVLGIRDSTVARLLTTPDGAKRRRIVKGIERRVQRNPQPSMGAFAGATLRDEQGRRYLLPNADDALLLSYGAGRRLYHTLESRGAPSNERDARGTRGTPLGDVLFYVAQPRAKAGAGPETPAVRERVQLLDAVTMTVYSGEVERSYFDRGYKTGHVVLKRVHEWGKIADPSQFGRLKK